MGDNWIGKSYLYACFLVNQTIPVIRDSWGVGALGLWQYKRFKINLIVYWVKHPAVREGITQKMTFGEGVQEGSNIDYVIYEQPLMGVS